MSVVLPDDTAGRPLTPGEQAAIADLERRFLIEAPAPVRDRLVGAGSTRRGRRRAVQGAGPLLALLGVGIVLVVGLIVVHTGLLGVAAVLASVAGTAALWPLLPPRFGGPVRSAWRRRRAVRGRR